MGSRGPYWGRGGIALAGAVAALAAAGPASAFQALPPGGQVNNDPAAGINPALSVSGEEPANADVVGGALTAGKINVPWAVLRQTETSPAKNQVFSRSFAAGAWTTRGAGTVGGRSSASPLFSGSLNFDQGQDGEAPAIDFAGTGRTVPWATWYENTPNLGLDVTFNKNNIFASRFDATQNKWVFAGQGRGAASDVPSLNIHTDQAAENPSVAGGTTVPGNAPGPWITWQETTTSPVSGKSQIFVEKPLGPGRTDCNGVTPGSATQPTFGGFCWQQTGLPRVGLGTLDPSLNVDPTRDGVEPDIAFTGPNDSVPWVVWYEQNSTGTSGPGLLHSNEMVFAAKGVAAPAPDSTNGGFQYIAVGSQAQGTLDTTGAPNNFGTCAVSASNEAQCSVNHDPNQDAEDPRVAAGTMNPANATSPWIVWDETVGTVKQVFVARLVGVGAAAHFEIVNGGAPISTGSTDSTRADITFSGHTPYVSWRENTASGERAFLGHFVNAAAPTFVLDESDVPLTPTVPPDVREPISSSCTANPFNQDGAACQGGAIGTPFFLYTNGTSPLGLFAGAYQPATPFTGAASSVTTSSAVLNGSVNPQGAPANVSFQFGATTAYGQSTTVQALGPDTSADAFSAALSGLAAGTTIHYRAIASSDFGTFAGPDQTLTTTTPPPPPPVAGKASVGRAHVSGTTASAAVTCTGDTSCRVTVTLSVQETFRGHRLTAVSARRHVKTTHKRVVLGTKTVTVAAGHRVTVRLGLNGKGRRLLATRHRLTARLRFTQSGRTVSSQKVTFKAHKAHHKPKPKPKRH